MENSQNDSSKKEYKEAEAALDAQIKENKLDKLISYTKSVKRNLNFKPEEGWSFKVQRTLDLKALPESQETIERVNEFQQDYQKLDNPILKELVPTIALTKGCSFIDLKNVNQVFQQGTTDIAHKEGQVILLDIWATWCGPCQQPMSHNQEMIEKNEESWKGKVRIVALSVDDDLEKVKERITQKGWTKLEHYKLNGWDAEHDAIKLFNVNGIPKVILIGPDRKIVFEGHPSECELEQEINKLIQVKGTEESKTVAEAEKGEKQDDGEAEETPIDSKIYRVIKSFLRESDKWVEREFPKIKLMKFDLQHVKTIESANEGQTKQYQKVVIRYTCKKQYAKSVQELVDKIKKNIGREFIKIAQQNQLELVNDTEENFKFLTTSLTEIGFNTITLAKGIRYTFELKKCPQTSELKLKKQKIPSITQVDKLPPELEEKENDFWTKWNEYYNKFCTDGRRSIDSIMQILRNGFNYAPVQEKKEAEIQKSVKNFKVVNDELLQFIKQSNNEGKLFDDQSNKRLNSLKYVPKFKITIDYSSQFDVKGNQIPDTNCSINPLVEGAYRKKDRVVFEKLLGELEKRWGKDQISFKMDETETVDLKFGEKCFHCSAALDPKKPQYFNYFKNHHVCIECANQTFPDQTGVERFLCPDNLVFINVNGDETQLLDIDIHQFGQNVLPAGPECNQDHRFACNGNACESYKSEKFRFICMSCRPGPQSLFWDYIDFCNTCHQILQNPPHEKHASLAQHLLDNDKHTPDHFLTRITFNNGYQNF